MKQTPAEIVAQLREQSLEKQQAAWSGMARDQDCVISANLAESAADLIEELADSAQDVANLFNDAGQLDSDPAWIPVALADLRQKLDELAKAGDEA